MPSLEPAEFRSWLSPSDAVTALEITHGCVSCRTESEFRDLFAKVGELVPFDFGCAVSGRYSPHRSVVPLDRINVSYPGPFIDEYLSRDFFRVDNVMKDALITCTARYCCESSPGRPPEITALCRDFGVAEGYVVGSRSPLPDGGGSLFLFKSGSMQPQERTASVLELLAPHLHLAFFRAFSREGPAAGPVDLSPREREILRWLDEGKSSWETSVILGISERTVNFHIYNAVKKLGAANRAQAVALAARGGLLD